MYPPIYKICAADSGVRASLGSDPVRLYPFGEAPQGSVSTYAVWQTVGGSPENYLDCLPDMDGFVIQVDTYAATEQDARSAALALRDAIEPHAHIVSWRGESRSPDTKKYRYSFTVDWWVSR